MIGGVNSAAGPVLRHGGCVAVALLALAVAVPASGATTTEQSASILIFPKVIVDGTRDTLIQISNTSNSPVYASCYYVNAAPLCIGTGDCLQDTCNGTCVPQWVEVDFQIWLTKQQPTHWSASSGRFPDPADVPCSFASNNYECDGAGLDPGRVPPVSSVPFQGELRCIEVDQSGAPLSGNHLKGEATIVSSDGDAAEYNAVGLLGEPLTNDGSNILCLGGGISEDCPTGAEYEGCGEKLIALASADGADSLLFGPTSTTATELTLVPCRADYEHQTPTLITVQFVAFNELEQRYSASTQVDCWRSFFLGDVSNIFTIAAAQTRFIEVQMRSSDGSISGFVGVMEEYDSLGDQQARVALNLGERGTREKQDLIFLPGGP